MPEHTVSPHHACAGGAALTVIEGVAAPLPLPNLDTDQIMPKQFLRIIDKSGLDRGLFHDMRFDEHGAPRADFVLNQPRYRQASVLVAGPNFGCGSSREHAVWGLQQAGIAAVIASGFGEIFYSNAFNNRLLLVMLPQAEVEQLLQALQSAESPRVRIDLDDLSVRAPGFAAGFTLAARQREMFRRGLDMIGLTLTQAEAIAGFARRHHAHSPWLYDVAAATMARLRAQADGQGRHTGEGTDV
ncbi:3-isopropylmalate dehydratase small subunit [Cupriavidus sp. USMAA2-4]|uniref:3-isopropylmalate dehydratase small subunit n=1 Tax=Cupriavidus sp. USMAA2-4 TaxID=876364 RepID=UPI0008A68DFC|nr:3-isopropylmalate dehydratase small subunit [Cupriavidus sp. USMAA2-4]AOY91939.1 3-isopropylmalate dehydratase small subunit [Cupriavidus sp. USMAA2-4]